MRSLPRAPSLLVGLAVGLLVLGCVTGTTLLSATRLTSGDLAGARYGSLYQFLRAHNKAHFWNPAGGQEILTVYGRGATSLTEGRRVGARLYVDEEEIPEPVPRLHQLPLSEIERLLILRPAEASARYGGEGRTGAVVVFTKGGG